LRMPASNVFRVLAFLLSMELPYSLWPYLQIGCSDGKGRVGEIL